MMRYSEISRDLSSDNLRYAEFVGRHSECPREASPMSDISTGSGPLMSHSPAAMASTCRRHHHIMGGKRYVVGADDEDDDDDDNDNDEDNGRQHRHYDNISLGNNRTNFSGFYAGLRSSKRFSSSGSNSSVNGTANGAATIGYVRQRKDSTKSTQSCHFDAESPLKLNGSGITKSLNIKGSRRKHSIGCLNAFSSSPDSPGNYYGVG